MNERERKNEQVKSFERESIRKNTDALADKLDKQLIENIKALQEKRNYEAELLASLHRLNAHDICPGSAPTCDNLYFREQEVNVKKIDDEHEPVHGDDCHCSKCCPNPKPNFFQKHKIGLLLGVLWAAIIVLALGLSPSGQAFDTIQNAWVELFVNVFKMAIFAIAGFATYYLIKKKEDEE